MKHLREFLFYGEENEEDEQDPNAEFGSIKDDQQEPEEGDEDQQLATDDDNDEEELNQVADKASEDPNKQGVIRKVPDAHLVYKRQTDDGTYEELWMYHIGNNMRDALKMRHAILSGTDIPRNRTQSDDANQKYTLWTVGNVEFVNVLGLPN